MRSLQMDCRGKIGFVIYLQCDLGHHFFMCEVHVRGVGPCWAHPNCNEIVGILPGL